MGAARAGRSADWLKKDTWENPSFDLSGSRPLVGTLRCALSLSSHLHFNSRSSLACLSSACISLGTPLKAKFTPGVSSVQSLTSPPPLSLSLSPCDQNREKESLLLNTTIRASKRKFAKCCHQVQVSGAPTASMQWLIQKKNAELFPATPSCVHGVLWISNDLRRVAALGNYMLSDATFNLFTPCDILYVTRTLKQNSDSVWVSLQLVALGSCQLHFDNVS